jgi:hypothetical protein
MANEVVYKSAEELMTAFEQFKEKVNGEMTDRMVRFTTKGNKTAGKDVRAYCQEIKGLMQDMRVALQALKNEGK